MRIRFEGVMVLRKHYTSLGRETDLEIYWWSIIANQINNSSLQAPHVDQSSDCNQLACRPRKKLWKHLCRHRGRAVLGERNWMRLLTSGLITRCVGITKATHLTKTHYHSKGRLDKEHPTKIAPQKQLPSQLLTVSKGRSKHNICSSNDLLL